MSRRDKILLSAYACEPGKGSEPAAGWNWATQMCGRYDVTVLTRANNREVIESAMQERQKLGLPIFEVIYYDLPSFFLYLKRKRVLSASSYYMIWQIFARSTLHAGGYDLVHHVTFNSFLCPGYWMGKEYRLVLGPLGGGMCVVPAYQRLFGKRGYGQKVRNLLVRNALNLPWIRAVYENADRILCANRETYDLIACEFGSKVEMYLDAGVDGVGGENVELRESGRSCHFLVVGNVIPRKGWRLALDAMRFLLDAGQADGLYLEFIGGGSEFEKARSASLSMGLGACVTWHGRIDHVEVDRHMSESDVLLFPSVRDTSGYVVLEAMAGGKPVICLDHQGGREMTTEMTALRIPVGSYQETVEAIAAAMLELAGDEQRRFDMGVAAKERIRTHYTWAVKGEFMDVIYKDVLGKQLK